MIYTNIDTITTESTSNSTAKTDRIILKETDRIRTSFVADLIKNDKNPDCCVSGKLVHEKKRKNDLEFPTECITKIDLKSGDAMAISLDTTETKNLFDGLKDRYDLYASTERIRFGKTKYARVDENTNNLLLQIKELRSAGKFSNIQIMKLMEHLTEIMEQDSSDEISQRITNIQTTLNLNRLKNVRNKINEIKNEHSEEVWQQFFTENQWLISILFQLPFTYFQAKAYVGGKEINNKGGNIVDFLYENEATHNVALIEIKTPFTKLLGKRYRNNIYSGSDELCGGVNQLLTYKQSLLSESTLVESKKRKVFNPLCVLIIGSTREFDTDENKNSSFELFRSALNGVLIVTYNELYAKLDSIITVLEEI